MKFVCSQDEDARCHRLLAVLTDVHQHAPDGFNVLDRVETLEDHKGILIVHWNTGVLPPRAVEKSLFNAAWQAVGKEPYDNVSHVREGDDALLPGTPEYGE